MSPLHARLALAQPTAIERSALKGAPSSSTNACNERILSVVRERKVTFGSSSHGLNKYLQSAQENRADRLGDVWRNEGGIAG